MFYFALVWLFDALSLCNAIIIVAFTVVVVVKTKASNSFTFIRSGNTLYTPHIVVAVVKFTVRTLAVNCVHTVTLLSLSSSIVAASIVVVGDAIAVVVVGRLASLVAIGLPHFAFFHRIVALWWQHCRIWYNVWLQFTRRH